MKITRKGYYGNVDIQFEIIHQLLHRETMFLPISAEKGKPNLPVRWLNASFINMLKRHWEQFKFLERDMNLYYSLATYKDFPMFSYSWRYKTQQQQIWLKEFINYVIKYDFFLETDSLDLNKSIKQDGQVIKNFLDQYQIKYSLKFSGSKGIHFIVPSEEFDHIGIPVVDKFGVYFDRVKLFKLLATRLKAVLGCETIDDGVFDIKRVTKCAYSWDVKSGLIAYPLTDDQFKNFTTEIVKPENVIKYNNHKRRLLWRNCEVPKEVREKQILKLFEDLDIDLEKFK